ncbi:MAG: hypothetical protein ACRC46_13495 [Thermoguttaceae bacterium]
MKCYHWVFVVIVAGLLGCSSSSQLEGLVPMRGVVLLDDQPIENAKILFAPKPGQDVALRSASAISGQGGTFSMMTLNPGDGVFPGTYLIAVEKTEMTDLRTPEQKARDESADVDENSKRLPPSPEPLVKAIVPTRYNDVNTSGLEKVVDSRGDKKFEIRLTTR